MGLQEVLKAVDCRHRVGRRSQAYVPDHQFCRDFGWSVGSKLLFYEEPRGEIGLLDIERIRLVARSIYRMHDLAGTDLTDARKSLRAGHDLVVAELGKCEHFGLLRMQVRVLVVRPRELVAFFLVERIKVVGKNAFTNFAHEAVVVREIVNR